MHFVPNNSKILKENAAANPLDRAVADNTDNTKLAQEGILTAAAAETDAINQYSQILDLISKSEDWLKTTAEETIEDIVAEEKKHFAQLAAIVSKLPAFEKEFAAGEEEVETGEDVSVETETEEAAKDVKESVEEKTNKPFNRYDSDVVIKIISEETGLSTDDLYNLADSSNLLGDIYPEQVDQLLNYCGFDGDTLDRIESRIVAEADVEAINNAKNAESNKELLDTDLYLLQNLIEDDDDEYDPHRLHHPEVKQKIQEIIAEFKKLEN